MAEVIDIADIVPETEEVVEKTALQELEEKYEKMVEQRQVKLDEMNEEVDGVFEDLRAVYSTFHGYLDIARAFRAFYGDSKSMLKMKECRDICAHMLNIISVIESDFNKIRGDYDKYFEFLDKYVDKTYAEQTPEMYDFIAEILTGHCAQRIWEAIKDFPGFWDGTERELKKTMELIEEQKAAE